MVLADAPGLKVHSFRFKQARPKDAWLSDHELVIVERRDPTTGKVDVQACHFVNAMVKLDA